jgi:hypothetical protein
LVADRIGIEQALSLVSAAPFVAAAFAIPLPDGKRVHSPLGASPVATPEFTGTDVARDV